MKKGNNICLRKNRSKRKRVHARAGLPGRSPESLIYITIYNPWLDGNSLTTWWLKEWFVSTKIQGLA